LRLIGSHQHDEISSSTLNRNHRISFIVVGFSVSQLNGSRMIRKVSCFVERHREISSAGTRLATAQNRKTAIRSSFFAKLWQHVPITIITTILVTVVWAYDHFSPFDFDIGPGEVVVQDIPSRPSKPLSETAPSDTRLAARHAPLFGFRRIQVAPNEVDYVAEDVTIRTFRPTSKARRVRSGNKQVNIGDDVTIRYFARHKPLIDPQR
jgi:hypothetical protein